MNEQLKSDLKREGKILLKGSLVIIALMFLFSIIIPMTSALKTSEFTKDVEKIATFTPTTTEYGKYVLEDYSWYSPWTKEKVAEVELDKNDDNCVACSSIQTIRLEKEMPLIDEVNYYEKALGIFNVKSSKVSNQKFYVHTSYKYDLVDKEYEETTCDETGEICSTETKTKQVYELKQQNEFLQEQINNLTGKDTKIEEANTRQDEALCSIKLFDWCLVK